MPMGTFDHCADDYAQHRPTYPEELFTLLARKASMKPGDPVADVGAGTGIFSRALASRGWRVIAIDPSTAMLLRMDVAGEDRSPLHPGSIQAVCAAAESVPLSSASVPLVTVAQAFHWFNPPFALAEFARVLRPGGTLCLAWNNRVPERSPFSEAYEHLIFRHNPKYDREYRTQDWSAKIAESGAFEAAEEHHFEHLWRMPMEGCVGFSRSASYIRNVLSHENLKRFEEELRGLIREHFTNGECRIPLRTEVWLARRET